ncbi:hypothetical protein IB49_09955 [Geobacillus sp. LC300]|nr:hypothetical protein IB49_09955 [Geobacillus sp. LC300]
MVTKFFCHGSLYSFFIDSPIFLLFLIKSKKKDAAYPPPTLRLEAGTCGVWVVKRIWGNDDLHLFPSSMS